jgi:hypothetical protein
MNLRVSLSCVLAVLAFFPAGCTHWPKDSLIRGAKVGATPWSPAVEAEVIATGKAAQNLSETERRELLQSSKK